MKKLLHLLIASSLITTGLTAQERPFSLYYKPNAQGNVHSSCPLIDKDFGLFFDKQNSQHDYPYVYNEAGDNWILDQPMSFEEWQNWANSQAIFDFDAGSDFIQTRRCVRIAPHASKIHFKENQKPCSGYLDSDMVKTNLNFKSIGESNLTSSRLKFSLDREDQPLQLNSLLKCAVDTLKEALEKIDDDDLNTFDVEVSLEDSENPNEFAKQIEKVSINAQEIDLTELYEYAVEILNKPCQQAGNKDEI